MPGFDHVADPGYSNVIHGAYKGYWDDLDMGLTQDGFTLRQQETGEDITADVTGDTIIDSIFRGIRPSITMTLENWNAQAIEPMIWWHGNSVPAQYEWGLSDGVGQSKWEQAKPLILVACAAQGFSIVPAAPDPDNPLATAITNATGAAPANPTIDPLDWVAFKTILRNDQDFDIVFSNRPRFLTLTLDIYPVANQFQGSALDPTAPDSVERINECEKIRFWAATRGTAPTAP